MRPFYAILLLALVGWVGSGTSQAQTPGANVYLREWPPESLGAALRAVQEVRPGHGAIFRPERLPRAVQALAVRAVTALRELPPDEAGGFLLIPFAFLEKLLPELEERAVLHGRRQQLRQTWQVAR